MNKFLIGVPIAWLLLILASPPLFSHNNTNSIKSSFYHACFQKIETNIYEEIASAAGNNFEYGCGSGIEVKVVGIADFTDTAPDNTKCITFSDWGINASDINQEFDVNLFFDGGLNSVTFTTENGASVVGTIGNALASAKLPADGSTYICATVDADSDAFAGFMSFFGLIPFDVPSSNSGYAGMKGIDDEILGECAPVDFFPISLSGNASDLYDLEFEMGISEVEPGDARTITFTIDACGEIYNETVNIEPLTGFGNGFSIYNFTLTNVPGNCDNISYEFCSNAGEQSYTTAFLSAKYDCICDINIGKTSTTCTDNGNNSFTGEIHTRISWSGPPSGEAITVTFDGGNMQTIPAGASSPYDIILTGIPADGTKGHTLEASFVTSTFCSTSASIRTPEPCPTSLGFRPGQACTGASDEIAGVVWEDWNFDGVMNETDTVGIGGIKVLFYDCDGVAIDSTYTDSDGNYKLSGLTGDYRVEFELPETVADWASPTPNGTDNGTQTQFLSPSECGNFGLASASDYCQTNPNLVVPCYVNGTGNGQSDAAIVSFAYTDTGLNQDYNDYNGMAGTGPQPSNDATTDAVGSVWGMAYQPSEQRMFGASFMKRHVGFADSPGHIYVMDYSSGAGMVAGSFNLEGVSPSNGGANIELGTVCRSATCASDVGNTGITDDYILPDAPAQANIDLDAFGKVGTMSYGDIDFQENSNYLWAVNLFQKALIRIDVSGNTASLPTSVEQYLLSDLSGLPTCTGGQLRPFALKFNNGRGYLGLVCDASASQNEVDLNAFVLSFDPNNIAAGFVTEMPALNMGYARKNSTLTGTSANNDRNDFQAWLNVYDPAATISVPYAFYSQPILSDIDFDGEGNMYLSFMDRWGHQIGERNYIPVSQTTTTIRAKSLGEIFKLCLNGTSYDLEGSVASCPINYPANVGPHDVGEFFDDESGDSASENNMGSLAISKGTGELLTIVLDPHPAGQIGSTYWSTQGVQTYSTKTGGITNWYSVNYSGDVVSFGKGHGLGDIEMLCNAAPLEVGNYVWEDTDGDGVQDACEPAIAGVIVELVQNGTVVATTTTDVNGEYYFSHSDNAAQTWTAGIDSLEANTTYTISIGNVIGGSQQAVLSNLELTQTDIGSGKTPDSNDNDGVLNGNNAEVTFTTGPAGSVDHSFDFGFFAERVDYPDYTNANRPCLEAPCHIIDNNLYLGNGVTADTPTGGDGSADADVDDGLSLSNKMQFTPGNTVRIPTTIFNNTGNNAFLRMWIDWNGDGDFEDANEQVEDNSYPSTGAANLIFVSILVPMNATQIGDIAIRARLSTDDLNSATPCGTGVCAADGEVEDYLLQVDCPIEFCVPAELNLKN